MAEQSTIKRAVISYENMAEDISAAFKEKYPHGYADYFGDIRRIEKPSGEAIHVVPLELPDAIYLVKVKVHIDKEKDVENDLFKDSDDEDAATEESGDFPVSDDDIAAGSDDPDESMNDE